MITWERMCAAMLKIKGGYLTNPEATYPFVCEDVYWQRDVKQMYIFSEKTGESLAGNLTAGRIIELADGSRSIADITKTLATEFSEIPSKKEMLAFVTEFLSECEQKQFIEFRSTPSEPVKKEIKAYTSKDVEMLIEQNAVLIIDEKASFEPAEDGTLMTYSLKEGRYLQLSEEEKEILVALLEEKPLQEVLSDVSASLGKDAKKQVADFAGELLNHELARVEDS